MILFRNPVKKDGYLFYFSFDLFDKVLYWVVLVHVVNQKFDVILTGKSRSKKFLEKKRDSILTKILKDETFLRKYRPTVGELNGMSFEEYIDRKARMKNDKNNTKKRRKKVNVQRKQNL